MLLLSLFCRCSYFKDKSCSSLTLGHALYLQYILYMCVGSILNAFTRFQLIYAKKYTDELPHYASQTSIGCGLSRVNPLGGLSDSEI